MGVEEECMYVHEHGGGVIGPRYACVQAPIPHPHPHTVYSLMRSKRPSMGTARARAHTHTHTVYYAEQASKPVNQAACLIKGSDGVCC